VVGVSGAGEEDGIGDGLDGEGARWRARGWYRAGGEDGQGICKRLEAG